MTNVVQLPVGHMVRHRMTGKLLRMPVLVPNYHMTDARVTTKMDAEGFKLHLLYDDWLFEAFELTHPPRDLSLVGDWVVETRRELRNLDVISSKWNIDLYSPNRKVPPVVKTVRWKFHLPSNRRERFEVCFSPKREPKKTKE